MDILQDRGFIRLISIKTAHPELIPAYVEQADLGAIEKSAGSLAETEFADDMARRFPLGDKASIWLAAAYYTKSASALQHSPTMREYITERIKAAADVYGIREDVDKAMTVLGQDKTACDEEVWGWIDDKGKKYPMHTADLTKQAMTYFEANRDKYPLSMRQSLAGNIYKRAQALGVEASDVVRKEAGAGYPDRIATAEALDDRCARLRPQWPALADQLQKLADNVKLASSDDLLQAVGTSVEALETIDKIAGFRYSGKGEASKLVVRPCDLFYSISPKQASADGAKFVRLDRFVFDCEKLAEMVPTSVYDGALGENFLRGTMLKTAGFETMTPAAFLKHTLEGLPDSDKAALERQLQTL